MTWEPEQFMLFEEPEPDVVVVESCWNPGVYYLVDDNGLMVEGSRDSYRSWKEAAADAWCLGRRLRVQPKAQRKVSA